MKKIKEQYPESKKFDCGFIGGEGWFWSKFTRNKILAVISRETDLEIQVQSEPFNNFPLNKVDVTICIDSGNLSYEKVKGQSSPKGIFWIIAPMQGV